MTYSLGSKLNGSSPQLSLTCIATGTPALSVSWTRDSEEIAGERTIVLDYTQTPQYIHHVVLAGELRKGLYECKVTDDKQSQVSAMLNVEGMLIVYT